MRYGIDLKTEGALDLVRWSASWCTAWTRCGSFPEGYHCDIHVGGGEFNVTNKSIDCFGMKTGIVSAMVDYWGLDRRACTRWA